MPVSKLFLPCFFLILFCHCTAQNSLIHLIWVEYGPFRCAQFFTEVQKMYEINGCDHTGGREMRWMSDLLLDGSLTLLLCLLF